MIVPQGQVSREKFSRVCNPIIGRGIARAGNPHDNMVVLNLDQESLAQQWSPPESEPPLFLFNAGRERTFPSAFARPAIVPCFKLTWDALLPFGEAAGRIGS
jgi:hypothetical protein